MDEGRENDGRWTREGGRGTREDGGRQLQKKLAKDLKAYQNWIYVGLNAKQTEKILAPQNRLLISDL